MKKFFNSFKLVLLTSLFIISVGCSAYNVSFNPSDNIYSGEQDSENAINSIASVSQSQTETDFSKLYQETFESIATVLVSNGNIGTGFIVNSQEGYIMTSSSLFSTDYNTAVEIVFSDGTKCDAELQSIDSIYSFGGFVSANSDIALLIIDKSDAIVLPEAVAFTNDNSLTYGDDCYTIATSVIESNHYIDGLLDANIISNPNNSHDSSFYYSDGEFFFDESLDYLIQTGLTSNKGNQGAPVFNKFGQVVGLINQRVNQTVMYQSNDPIGITFATPSTVLCNYLEGERVDFHFIESDSADIDNVIVNADSLQKSTDRVAKILMNLDAENAYGSNDYFVVSESESNKIIMNSSTNTQNSTENVRYTSSELAEYSFNKCLKIIVYSEQTGWLGKVTPIISEGSGFLINKSGYVLTNLHVINKLAGSNQEAGKLANSTVDIDGIHVYGLFQQGTYKVFENGKYEQKFLLFPMDVVSQHKNGDLDLAVLKFKNDFYYADTSGESMIDGISVIAGFPDACVFETSLPNKGERVYAVGNALGYGISITTGIISNANFSAYYYDYGYNMIQMDCPINSGNSGGGLFNSFGRIVGINTLGLSGEAVVSLGYENVSFAIPTQVAVSYLKKLNIEYNQ